MALRVQFVTSLADVVGPVGAWLDAAPSDTELFRSEHLLLPTNGAKAWLLPELAKRVGARPGRNDGVVANVQVGYLGSLNKFIVPQRFREIDPWSIDSMTGVILGIIANDPAFAHIVKRSGGALQAAARLADRFDRYHARRPMMIRAWANKSPVFAPSAADSFNDGEWRAAQLDDQQWQFDLWRRVREGIDVPSWPEQIATAVQQLRRGENIVGIPSRLMVAGMQSLSLGAIELLDAFGHVSDVEVLLVHPSPVLARRWADEVSKMQTHRGVLQPRPVDEDVPDNVHPLSYSWLRGARELQQMLHSQGVVVEPHANIEPKAGTSLLGHIQSAIAGDGLGERVDRDASDLSVQIHRCYSLTRQVEALHDALLHAFRDLENLAPHEVVIVSPRLAEAAPILDAVFDRTVKVAFDVGSHDIRIPLAIAERQLRFVSPGAQFVASLLELMTGRFDVTAFMEVATSPLVVDHLGVTGEVVSVWERQIERTRVFWGLSADQRTAVGLAPEAKSAHTWKHAIERSLLGASVPDAQVALELGDVVPLADVGVDDLDALARLVQIFDVVSGLEARLRKDQRRGIVEWCDELAAVVRELCGDGDAVAGAFEILGQLAASTTLYRPDGSSTACGAEVSFAEIAGHLLNQISGVPGHQPLRTGAVTATSMMPLRGVPYRVVCLLGVDDGVFGSGELESDDLIGRQVFIGDDDPRVDSRRQLLDAVLSAGERVVITCDGRSIQNNANIPLTTALAEFIDFARSLGVADHKGTGRAGEGTEIEFFHPRHATSARNFELGGVVPGIVWSHAIGARDISAMVCATSPIRRPSAPVVKNSLAGVIDLDSLAKFVRDPLRMFVNDILGINTWKDSVSPDRAVIPFAMDDKAARRFVLGCIEGEATLGPEWSSEAYLELARLNGDVPVGAYGAAEVQELIATAAAMSAACKACGVSPIAPEATPIKLSLGDGVVLGGSIPHVQPQSNLLGLVSPKSKYDADLAEMALRLLAVCAEGSSVRHGAAVHAHKDGGKASTRIVFLADSIDDQVAKRRLFELVELRARASVSPMPSFGGTVDAIFKNSAQPSLAAGKAVFDKFIGPDSYPDSLESRIFGDNPKFEEIFAESGPIYSFWRDFHQVLHLTTGKDGKNFGKLPTGTTYRQVM